MSPRLKSVEDRDAAPPQQLESDGAVPSEPAPSRHPGLIFVCDPSAEAERLMTALRSRGYPAVDVPLGLLPSRLRYQVPDLVVCDADAPEVLDQVRDLRANEPTRGVQVVFLGSEEGALQRDPAFRAEGHGVFFRPLDVDELCKHIEGLIGPPSRAERNDAHSIAPRRAPVIVPSARKPYRSDEGPVSSRLLDSLPPPSERGLGPTPRFSLVPSAGSAESDGAAPELSAETRALLDRAHAAASAMLSQTSRPYRLTADAEFLGEVDFDVLAALEAPLDDPLDPSGESEISGGTAGGLALEVGSSPPGPNESPSQRPSSPVTPHSYASEAAVTNPGGRVGSQPAPGWDSPVPTSPPTSAATVHGLVRADSDLPSLPGNMTATVAPPRRRSEPARPPEEPNTIGGDTPRPEPPADASPLVTDPPLEEPAIPRRASELPPAPVVLPTQALGEVRLAELGRTPEELRAGSATRALATAIRERATGALALQDAGGIRRVVLQDGDIVTAVSGASGESLVRFLEAIGDLDPATADQLSRSLPAFGRHAGAGLIAHGQLQQGDLWPVLRAHAEWILAAVVAMRAGRMSWEEEIPVRLQDEPAVFGGAAGCEVFVEAVRRSVDPASAWAFLGAGERRLGVGGHRNLLGECALEPELEGLIQEAVDAPLEPLYRVSPELITVLYALVEIDVFMTGGGRAELAPTPAGSDPGPRGDALPPEAFDDVLDDTAFEARVMARRALVDEGDYFSILGVKRDATEYEITRARDALHRQLSPSRLSARNAHLLPDVELVLDIVDEAYAILKDDRRRERYRRALEARPA